MFKVLTLILSYLIYVVMYFKFQYPETEYMYLMDNFIVMYKIIYTVCLVPFSLIILALMWANTTSQPLKISVSDAKKFEEATKELGAKTLKLRWVVSTFFSVCGFLFAFIALGDYYLGILFALGIAFFYTITIQLRGLLEKARKQLEAKNG